jgi:tol-pal system protein YbgF
LTAGLFLSLGVLPSLGQDEPPEEFAPDPAPAPAAMPQAGDSLGGRLGRLEEKVQSLQISIGTLESFLRTKPGKMLPQEAPAPVAPLLAPQTDLSPRIEALETQIGALTGHMEQLSRQMSALEAKLSAAPAPLAPPPGAPRPERQGEAPPLAPDSDLASADIPPGDENDFKPGGDALADFLEGQSTNEAPDGQPQSLMAALPVGDAQALYQQGYASLLQKDHAGAEGAFRQLLEDYPNDPLAGSAQYWIGESYYERGQYKNAADAFLKGYKKYKSSEKAPDTLLKLGMSLAELSQKDAACSTFKELKAKYPSAPEHIADEAKAERKKIGC